MLNHIAKAVKKSFFTSSTPIVNSIKGANKVVLILGWGGSSASKNYGRILRHYESRGVSTIIHTMPLLCPKFIRTSFEEDLERLVLTQNNEAHDTGSKSVTFDIHLFSQNGTWVYSQLMKRGVIPKPRKLIMDSAPFLQHERNVSFEAESLSRLFTSLVMNKAQYYQFPFTPMAKCALYVIMGTSLITDKLIPFKYYFATNYLDMHKHLRDHSPNVPTLFIHSDGDKLIPSHAVHEYKQIIESRGVPTEERVFGEEVSHISTMYRYPNEYMEIVDEWFELLKD